MSRPCTLCRHPERSAIDAALRAREPLRTTAARFGTSLAALHRHRHGHLAPAPPALPPPADPDLIRTAAPAAAPPGPPPAPVEALRVCADCGAPYVLGSNYRCQACLRRRTASAVPRRRSSALDP